MNRQSPSGRIMQPSRSFSWALRRTATTANSSANQNMVFAGYGSTAEVGSRIRYVRGISEPITIQEIWLGAVLIDGTLVNPTPFPEGSIPTFRISYSENYEIGPWTSINVGALSSADTARAALKRFTNLNLTIPKNNDWALICGTLGNNPGFAQSYSSLVIT